MADDPLHERILLVANTLPPHDISGVGEQVLQLAEGLRQRGAEVEVLGRGGQKEDADGARGPKVLFPLTIVPAVRRRLRSFRPTVLQVHESDGALALWAGRRHRRRSGQRLLLVALQQVSYVRERRAVRPLRDASDGDRVIGRPGSVEKRFRWLKAPLQILLGRWTARWADRVLAPSERTAGEIELDYLRGKGRGGEGDVRVVPNVTGGLVHQTVASFEDPADEPVFLFVGRLRLRKGVETLLAAYRRLEDSGSPPAPLWIVGSGEHQAALRARVEALGLRSVRFLGRRSGAEVRGLFERSRALVVPSTYEGMPLVILEAMEAALPVIASDVSGIPEVVVDGVTGRIVPPEDSAALAAVLREAQDHPERAKDWGQAGRRRLDEHYRPHHGAKAWIAALSDLLE
ncbi:MAG: glycosyltransferase family 4 protein [Acidobacteriota bacterium]